MERNAENMCIHQYYKLLNTRRSRVVVDVWCDTSAGEVELGLATWEGATRGRDHYDATSLFTTLPCKTNTNAF
jgi:hypothetical protein